ncbi:MAG: GmrSD restriction endonuclease domain-containing protein [Thermoleophilia bacterium]
MSLFEDTNPRALKDLLSEIHSCTMALPDFQRDFVWDPSATQELIVSIANNYPAGSLLRVRDGKQFFAPREFEGAPSIKNRQHTFLVLDGQQRLTSLYQAFYGVGDHRYYLSLGKLLDGGDFDEAIFHYRVKTKWAEDHEGFAAQARDLVLPLSVLKGGAGGFLQWLLQVTNPMPPEERMKMQDALTAVNDQWIKAIDDYHFPVVTLSDKTNPDALCTIFETLNRTGVKLGVFELLTARFWSHDIKLRDLWTKARDDYEIIDDYDVDPYYLLQAISLASRKAPSCKRGDVLNLTPSDIKEWWQPVVEGLAAGLSMLRDDCKVMLPKWLPYQTMLPSLAAVLAKSGMPKNAEAGAQREKLKRWFWCSVFGQAYESAANSQSARDVTELLAWFSGGPPPESVTKLSFDPRALRDITPRQRSTYRGAICLILGTNGGARDFHTLSVITGKLMNDEKIDDHHVFPDGFLQKHIGVTEARARDCVLNRTLIDRTTNQMISNRAPSAYLADIRQTPGFPFQEVLSSHCLPTDEASPLWSDDYEAFLIWRQDRLWQEIKRVTGLTEAADLETQETAYV